MSIKTNVKRATGALLLALALPATGAEGLSAQQIMEKNFFVTKVRTLKTDSTMVLINDRGQTRERKSTTLTKLQKNGIDSKLLAGTWCSAQIYERSRASCRSSIPPGTTINGSTCRR